MIKSHNPGLNEHEPLEVDPQHLVANLPAPLREVRPSFDKPVAPGTARKQAYQEVENFMQKSPTEIQREIRTTGKEKRQSRIVQGDDQDSQHSYPMPVARIRESHRSADARKMVASRTFKKPEKYQRESFKDEMENLNMNISEEKLNLKNRCRGFNKNSRNDSKKKVR